MKGHTLIGLAFSLVWRVGIGLWRRVGVRAPALPCSADFVLPSADGPIDASPLGSRLVMISFDPEPETRRQLKRHTAVFHPAMPDVMEKAEQASALAKVLGDIRPAAKPDSGDTAERTRSSDGIAPNGKLAAVLELGASNEPIVAAARKRL